MAGRLLRHKNDACNIQRRISMFLKGRIPEVLGMQMVGREKSNVRRKRIGRERKLECNFDRCAVRPFCFALETVKVKIADAATTKCIGVRGTASLQHEHRQSLPLCEEVAVECTERKLTRGMRRYVGGVGECEQFDVRPGELDNVILCSPLTWVHVARADLKSQVPIECDGRIEVVDSVHDMIEAAWHRLSVNRHLSCVSL